MESLEYPAWHDRAVAGRLLPVKWFRTTSSSLASLAVSAIGETNFVASSTNQPRQETTCRIASKIRSDPSKRQKSLLRLSNSHAARFFTRFGLCCVHQRILANIRHARFKETNTIDVILGPTLLMTRTQDSANMLQDDPLVQQYESCSFYAMEATYSAMVETQ